jgi:hypothetical protein
MFPTIGNKYRSPFRAFIIRMSHRIRLKIQMGYTNKPIIGIQPIIIMMTKRLRNVIVDCMA